MYIKATITSATGRFRAHAECSHEVKHPALHGIEFNAPHSVEWAFSYPVELTITQAYRVGHASMEYRTAMRDAGRGRLLP